MHTNFHGKLIVCYVGSFTIAPAQMGPKLVSIMQNSEVPTIEAV